MEIGNEISHKIRSAIKAKLVELGAYVDEELPDYIMVMVANKKSQLQMSEDLGLFLAANTERFTTWLHGLLQKLQSITSENTLSSKVEKTVEKPKDTSASTVSNDNIDKEKKHAACDNKSKTSAPTNIESDGEKEIKRLSDLQQEKQEQSMDAATKVDVELEEKREIEDHSANISDNSVIIISQTESSSANESPAISKDDSKTAKCTEVHSQADKEEELSQKDSLVVEENIIDNAVHVVEEDDLSDLLLTENDELTAELEQETPVVIPPVKKGDSSKLAITRINDDKTSGTEYSRKATTSDVLSRLSSRTSASPVRQSHRSAVVRAVEPRSSDFSRKRRAPVSVIGSVSRDSEDEDGYDPRSPAVGSVASVVRVTARKSSIPPKLQANKSLLLKAMTEAEKSVERQRRVAITPIRPFIRSEGQSRERDRDGEKSRRTASGSADANRGSLRLAKASVLEAITQPGPSRQWEAPAYIPTRKVQPAPRIDSADRERVGIVSRSRRQEAQQRAWVDQPRDRSPPRKLVKQEDSRSAIVNFVIETDLDSEDKVVPKPSSHHHHHHHQSAQPVRVKQEPLSPELEIPVVQVEMIPKVKQRLSALDSRVVECENEVVVGAGSMRGVVTSQGAGSIQGVPVLLEDMDQDDFALDLDIMEPAPPPSSALVEMAPPPSNAALMDGDLRLTMARDRSRDKTRFVVTLDGGDVDQYGDGDRARLEEDMAGVEEQVRLTVAQPAMPSVTLMSPPKIQPLNISLRDSDEEGEAMEAEPTPLKKAKMAERCKFWPACVNGGACDYHHPTVHCKTFPLCKFGDKCLYIHPNCRYDSKCARPDCPYTHSSRRSIPAFQAPHLIPVYRAPPPPIPVSVGRGKAPPLCRFFPACSNMSCPFLHPKPCRFGLACKNKDKGCPFFHPSLPSKDKLTWAAAKTPAEPPTQAPPAEDVTAVKT